MVKNCTSRWCTNPLGDPPAMGYKCVCMTGTVQNKAGVQSKSRRKKLFTDMSHTPFAALEMSMEIVKQVHCT